VLISSPLILNASHIVGGKITYRYLGSNNYEIKLTVYRDCSDLIDFDNPAPITIFDNGTNAVLYNNQVTLFHRDTINPNNPNPCFIPPPGICVEEGYYLDTVNLPPNVAGYTATYQRCCHNSSLLNIINPSFNGTTITTNIPPQINNSATFLNFPPIYVCVNDTFNYSFSATDIDNDSLVYQMCTPLSGITFFNGQPNPATPPPYSPLSWSNGYSANNPLTNLNGINFNSTTGTIHFVPTLQGQFAVGICVLEYRNGVLLNTNSLEIQFNVVPCYIVSSIPTATNICEGLNVHFQNGSTNATAYHWDFGVPTILTDTSNIISPTYIFPSYGTYTISLVAINTSYGLCKDTTTKAITINPLLAPVLQPTFSACYKNNAINLNVGGSFDNSATFNWDLGSNATPSNPTTHNPTIHFDTLSQNVSVIVSQFGCSDTLHSSINFINPIASINTGNLNCNGSKLNFASFSSNATNVFWDFGVSALTNDTSSFNSTVFNYPAYGNYTVTLIAYNGACSDTLRLPISVNDTLSLNPINTIETQCLNGNSFNFFANGHYSNNAVFTWQFDPTASTPSSTQENPANISFSTTGVHAVRFYITDNGCSKQRLQVVKVLPSPQANFISDTIGCEPLTIHFTNQTLSSIPFTSKWKIENNFFNVLDASYTFNNSGLYSVYLTVNDTNNCSDTLKKIDYIRVLPKPKASALVDPFQTDIINPVINFTDNTLNTHTTYFDFGDNQYSNQTSNTHIYSDTGRYIYSLIVVTEFGCRDTIKGVIEIKGYNNFYIPNSFTPNDDGLNDRFKPIITNYNSAILKIFNRWGDMIFSTHNVEQGWDGRFKNSNSPPDVYVYQLSIDFIDGTTKIVNGSVILIR